MDPWLDRHKNMKRTPRKGYPGTQRTAFGMDDGFLRNKSEGRLDPFWEEKKKPESWCRHIEVTSQKDPLSLLSPDVYRLVDLLGLGWSLSCPNKRQLVLEP